MSSSASTSESDSDDNRRVVKSKSRSKTTQLLKKRRRISDDKAEEASSDETNSQDSEEGSSDERNLHDSEEEEDNDDRPSHQIRKKKKKSRVQGFINDEAEVDDDIDDDEEEWEEGAYEHAVNETDEAGPTARDIEGRRRMDSLLESYDSENIEEYFQKKYADQRELQNRFGHGSCMSDEINQTSLLPAITDPKLWSVKCRIGEEKKTALLLMRKFLTYANTDKPLQIKSVVVPESAKGYVYIESYKQPHVKAAIEGVSALNQYKQEMVPIKEMTDIMKVLKLNVTLKRNQWVRIKRGIYKDDIAQVYHVAESQNKVELKLLPKIDYTRMRGALKTVAQNNPDAPKKKPKRPTTAKLFDPEAVRAIGGEVVKNHDFYVFEGNKYTEKGFLIKSFPLNAINSDGVQPTLSELEKFELSPETIALELGDPGTGTATKSNNCFSTGDNVEVCDGELLNLRGKITAVDGDTITIMPNHEDLKEPIEFHSNELRKYFEQGNHVKVQCGKYEGNTGLVVRVEDNRVVVLSDISIHEIEVLPQNLQLCGNVASGVDSHGQYQINDLVQIDAQTVGVIVRLERDCYHILSMYEKIIKAKPGSISKKHSYRKTALDCQQNSIQVKDIVKVIDGPHSGEKGEIKHLFQSFVFLYSRTYVQNGGIFICKTRHLQLDGGMKITPSYKLSTGYMSPRISSPSPAGNYRRGGGGRGSGRGGMPGRDRTVIGQTVKITGGPYKGHIGFVKDATDSLAKVELHSKCQTISVDRSHIAIVGQPSNQKSTNNFYSKNNTQTSIGDGSQTPLHGAYGSKTPMYGSQTPMYDVGSRTPHYGSMTPNHDGSRTPGQSGAWDPTVANTPARNSDFDNEEDWSVSSVDVGGSASAICENRSYTPETSSMYGSEADYSPYEPSASPAPSVIMIENNSNCSGPSSLSSSFTAESPTYSYGMPSPIGACSPMTSASAHQRSAGMAEWLTDGIVVKVNSKYPSLTGQHGVIRGISGIMCAVFLVAEERVVNLGYDELEPVEPKSNDRVKVIIGPDRESIGSIMTIENNDAVVKFQAGALKLLPLKNLGKLMD
ncbi:transcription elongation factor SPT5-like [Aphidius gifuensis]|nr:transcription elongation factor SPT5-like [Aphidius gifuensis]